MAALSFDPCIAFSFQFEGGFVDNPKDPGGATNLGVTIYTLSKWRGHPCSVEDVKRLDRSEAKLIYRKDYWDKIGGDSLPVGFDLVVLDAAINSGVGRALKWKSLALAKSGGDVAAAIRLFCSYRLSFVQGLRTFPIFGNGWRSRINACEAKALAMHAGPNAKVVLTKEAVLAKSKRAVYRGAAHAASVTGAGSSVLHTSNHSWLLILAIVLSAIGLGCFIIMGLLQAQRAKALSGAAASAVQPLGEAVQNIAQGAKGGMSSA